MKKIKMLTPKMIKLSYRTKTESKDSSVNSYVLFPANSWETTLDEEKKTIELILGAGSGRLYDNLEDAKKSDKIPVGAIETFSVCKQIAYSDISELDGALDKLLMVDRKEAIGKYITILDIDFHGNQVRPDKSCLNGIVPSPDYLVTTERGFHCIYSSDDKMVPAKQRASLACLWVSNKVKGYSGIDIISKCRRHTDTIARFYNGGGELYGKKVHRVAGVYHVDYKVDTSMLESYGSARVEDWRCPFGDHAHNQANRGLSIYELDGDAMIHCFRCSRTAPLAATEMDEDGKYVLKYKTSDHLYQLYRNKFWSYYLIKDMERLIRQLRDSTCGASEENRETLIKDCIRGLSAYTHGVNSYFHMNCLNPAGDNLVRTIQDPKEPPVWTDDRNYALKGTHLEKIVSMLPFVKYKRIVKDREVYVADLAKQMNLIIARHDRAGILPDTNFVKGYRPNMIAEDITSFSYTEYLNPVYKDASLQKLPEHLIKNPVDALRVIQDYAVNPVRRLYVDKGLVKRKSIYKTDFEEGRTLKSLPAENIIMTMLQIGYCNIPRNIQLPILVATGQSGGGKDTVTKVASAIMGVSHSVLNGANANLMNKVNKSVQKLRADGADVLSISEFFKSRRAEGSLVSNQEKMTTLFTQTDPIVEAEVIYRGVVKLKNSLAITVNNAEMPEEILGMLQILRRVALLPAITKPESSEATKGEGWNFIDLESISSDEHLYVACHSLRDYIMTGLVDYHNPLSSEAGQYMGSVPRFTAFYEEFKQKAISDGYGDIFLNESRYVSVDNLKQEATQNAPAKQMIIDIIQKGFYVAKKRKVRELVRIDLGDGSELSSELESAAGVLDPSYVERVPEQLNTYLHEQTLLEDVVIRVSRKKSKFFFSFGKITTGTKRDYWKISELRNKYENIKF